MADWVWSDEIDRSAMGEVGRGPVIAIRRRHDESLESTIGRLVSDGRREVEMIEIVDSPGQSDLKSSL